MTLDFDRMDVYDITTLLPILAEDYVEMYIMKHKCKEIEEKHKKTYYGRPDWQQYSSRFVELEYEYGAICKEIIRRTKKND